MDDGDGNQVVSSKAMDGGYIDAPRETTVAALSGAVERRHPPASTSGTTLHHHRPPTGCVGPVARRALRVGSGTSEAGSRWILSGSEARDRLQPSPMCRIHLHMVTGESMKDKSPPL